MHLISLGLMEAIVTGESRVSLNRALHETNLPSVLDVIRCADETFYKSHPALLQEMKCTVMIGDTTHDLQIAGNAGAAGVRRPVRCVFDA